MTSTNLQVSTKKGVINFSTSLEWDEACEVLSKVEEKSDFIISLLERNKKNKYMSDSQVSWVYYLAEQSIKPLPVSDPFQGVKADNIIAALANASAHGKKRPTLKLGSKIRVKFMTKGKNSGGAWITTDSGELIGKINSKCETFVYSSTLISKDDLLQTISDFNNDLESKICSEGIANNQCMCCGLPLTNELSIRLGIGPICREKYFG
jgi:hypothetical protein